VVPFTLRSLMHDPVRLLMSVCGVAAAVLLVLVLRGILDGTIDKATWYIERVDAELFVTQAGVANMGLATPVIPAEVERAVLQVSGVEVARGIIRVPALVRIGSSEVPASIVGFDPADGIGGPWRIDSGSTALTAGGAIIDVQLARQRGLRLGDTIDVADRSFRIEALARETNAMATGRVVFIRRDTAEALFRLSGTVNWVLVRTVPDAEPAQVAAAIEQAIPGIVAHTRSELLASDRNLFQELFGLPVNVMATIGYLVGLLVVGLATYAAAAERTRDFGVLKAIGARNRFVYRSMLQIALVIAVTGYALGVALTLALAPLVTALAPELGVAVRPAFVAQAFATSTLLALLAALVPVRRMAGLDPREALS
jgi:putative ABC transport system permease protein